MLFRITHFTATKSNQEPFLGVGVRFKLYSEYTSCRIPDYDIAVRQLNQTTLIGISIAMYSMCIHSGYI